MAESPISRQFEQVRAEGRMAFMPFVTAGDPDLKTTQLLLGELADRGVDLIEVGFPYSDPIADGPVIQASYQRALDAKVSVGQIFDAISQCSKEREASQQPLPPLVAMVSYALMFRNGAADFVQRAKAAGFSGFIVPDLPGDEAEELFQIVTEAGLDLVQLIAPTTPRERVRHILASCSGFVYCIAVAGITGERTEVAQKLLDQLRWLKEETDLPLAVGFGISKPDHVDPLRSLADGVIVGSAIVRQVEAMSSGGSHETTLKNIGEYAATMVQRCRSEK